MIDLRDSRVQELRNTDEVDAIPVDTKDNVADILTKSLSGTVVDRLTGVVDRIARGVAGEADAKG